MNAETESFGGGLHSHLVFDLVHLSYICIEMCHKYSFNFHSLTKGSSYPVPATFVCIFIPYGALFIPLILKQISILLLEINQSEEVRKPF